MDEGTNAQFDLFSDENNRPPADARIISVRQPWAWLIINAGKDIENRDWPAEHWWTKVRGRVLIHASKGVTKDEWLSAWEWVRHIAPDAWEKGRREILPGTIERGGIIGSVEIVDCVTRSDSRWFQGRLGLVLQNQQPLPFYRCNGKLGFFRL